MSPLKSTTYAVDAPGDLVMQTLPSGAFMFGVVHGDETIEIEVSGEALCWLREFLEDAECQCPTADLKAKIEAAKALHTDAGISRGYFPGARDYGIRDHCCGECGSHGDYGVEYPCPTMRALTDAKTIDTYLTEESPEHE